MNSFFRRMLGDRRGDFVSPAATHPADIRREAACSDASSFADERSRPGVPDREMAASGNSHVGQAVENLGEIAGSKNFITRRCT
jgi:hypothetical protein